MVAAFNHHRDQLYCFFWRYDGILNNDKTIPLKKIYGFLIILIIVWTPIRGQDIPPSVSSPTLFESGSIIIPLTSDLQPDPIDGVIDLKVYGLVYYLLDQGINFHWIIKSGKAQNGIDFSAQMHEINPTDGPSQVQEIISSAFVVDRTELELVECDKTVDLLENFMALVRNSAFSGIHIYQLDEAKTLDSRHYLDNPPKIAVLNDGLFSQSHTGPLDQAGIPYVLISSDEFFNNSECFNVITQAHISEAEIQDPSYYTKLRAFLERGGNFIAQCASILTFEEQSAYQFDAGILETGEIGNTSYNYLAPDMALFQIEGTLPPTITGTVSSFGGRPGSVIKNQAYKGITNRFDDIVISSADVNGAATGGNMMYISGHAYEGFIAGSLQQKRQFKRVFYNALFISGASNFACAGENICICEGDEVALGCNNLLNEPIYNWSPVQGLSCTDCPHPLASPLVTTTYYQTIAGSPCSLDSVTVFVQDFEPIDLGPDTTLCQGGQLSYDLSPFGQGTFVWQDGSTLPTYTVTKSGVYWAEKTNNGCTVRDSVRVIIADFSEWRLPSDTLLCDMQTIGLDATTEGDILYRWDDGSIDPKRTVSAPGLYWVEIRQGTCSKIDSIVIDVLSSSSISLGADTILCEREGLKLEPSVTSDATFVWQDGSTQPFYQANSSGLYWVEAQLSNCTLRDSIAIFIAQGFPLDLGDDVTICQGESIQLDAGIGVPAHYLWNDGDTAAVKIVDSDGRYTILVTEGRCSYEDAIEVTTQSCINCVPYIPSAFTPDFNGWNDGFKPQFKPECMISDYRMYIFNRWGDVITIIEDKDRDWNGLHGSTEVSSGVYLYLIRYTDPDGKIQTLSGDLTLIR